MMKFCVYFPLVSVFFFTASNFIFPQNNLSVDTVVINNLNYNTNPEGSAAVTVDYKEAAKRAVHAHLTLLPDEPPVIDNKAFYLTQYQTVIPVRGYNRNLLYRVYFDFFRYKEEKIPYNTKLKVFIRDIYGKKTYVGTADFTFMSEKKKFEVQIPFDLSYPGEFDIVLHEYALKAGNWGIWDIIVSSKKLNEIDFIQTDSAEKINEIEPKIFK